MFVIWLHASLTFLCIWLDQDQLFSNTYVLFTASHAILFFVLQYIEVCDLPSAKKKKKNNLSLTFCALFSCPGPC